MPAIRPRIDVVGISTAKSIDFILDHAHAYTDDGNCGDLAESRTMVNVDRFDISNLKIMFAFLRDPSMSVLELPVSILRKLNVRIGPTTLKLASLTLSHHLGPRKCLGHSCRDTTLTRFGLRSWRLSVRYV